LQTTLLWYFGSLHHIVPLSREFIIVIISRLSTNHYLAVSTLVFETLSTHCPVLLLSIPYQYLILWLCIVLLIILIERKRRLNLMQTLPQTLILSPIFHSLHLTPTKRLITYVIQLVYGFHISVALQSILRAVAMELLYSLIER